MSMTQPEKDAIKQMVADAEIYGFGNFIGWLKQAWVKILIEEGLDEQSARKMTEVDPYPQDQNLDET